MNQEGDDVSEPVEIPLNSLSGELLDAIMDEFIHREGTDYGEVDLSLQSKRSQLRAELERGRAVIVFDPVTESTTIMPR